VRGETKENGHVNYDKVSVEDDNCANVDKLTKIRNGSDINDLWMH
jgi:hypothetical protein